ncbi:hypothetical protein ACIBCR_14820 [Micromonospora echinospora]|uniref:hypothetical protein n=1 Tax=Micromonospora echinospora TaxID=1877 RepID=UPI0037AB8A76
MTVHIVAEPHFTGLTARDSRGATLTIERNDNAVAAWIAPPGCSDGFSVLLNDADRQQAAAFLAPELVDQLEAARAMCDELRERNEKLTAAVDRYADELRADASKETDDAVAVGLLRAADGLGDLMVEQVNG